MTPIKYSMSFRTGALFRQESVKIVTLYSSHQQWENVRSAVLLENAIQARTTNTLKRVTNEIISRMKTLNKQELAFLVDASYDEQGYMLWLAICRRYAFIADFAVDIVHNNFASFKNIVTYEDYNTFFNSKAEWHSEVDTVAPSTKRKLRQTLFQMMREAGLLEKNNAIIPMIPSAQFQATLAAGAERENMFFPISGLTRRSG